jgi:sortase (surface protein transpeptidase)
MGLIAVVAMTFAAACGQSGHTASSHRKGHAASITLRHVPVKLVIPKIGLDASVEQVGLDKNHNMDVPRLPRDAGWYQPGPAPGQAGDAVIDGHLNWTDVPRAVFFDLDKVQVGDQVDVIAQDGAGLLFQVTDTLDYPYTAHPAGLFATGGQPELSLITCAGSWDGARQTYLRRLVVNASFLGPAS